MMMKFAPTRSRIRRTISTAPEMEDLQRDFAIVVMHGLRDRAVCDGLGFGDQCVSAIGRPTLFIGSDPAGHNQADTALGALTVERRHPVDSVGGLLKSDVHRAHEDAVLQCREAQIQWFEQVRVRRHVSSVGRVLIGLPGSVSR